MWKGNKEWRLRRTLPSTRYPSGWCTGCTATTKVQLSKGEREIINNSSFDVLCIWKDKLY